MTDIISLSAKRFHEAAEVSDAAPEGALEAAKEWLREVGSAGRHVIIFVGHDSDDGGSGTRFFQAGPYRYHAQMGLIHEGMQMMRDAG